MVGRQERLLSKCPLCNHDDEHILHILSCPSLAASEVRSNLLEELVVWLDSLSTAPTISNFIKLGLTTWFADTNKIWTSDEAMFTGDIETDTALRSQIRLGWYFLLCDMLTTEMVDLQQAYYTKMKSKTNKGRDGLPMLHRRCGKYLCKFGNTAVISCITQMQFTTCLALPNSQLL